MAIFIKKNWSIQSIPNIIGIESKLVLSTLSHKLARGCDHRPVVGKELLRSRPPVTSLNQVDIEAITSTQIQALTTNQILSLVEAQIISV